MSLLNQVSQFVLTDASKYCIKHRCSSRWCTSSSRWVLMISLTLKSVGLFELVAVACVTCSEHFRLNLSTSVFWEWTTWRKSERVQRCWILLVYYSDCLTPLSPQTHTVSSKHTYFRDLYQLMTYDSNIISYT